MGRFRDEGDFVTSLQQKKNEKAAKSLQGM
jgi:hypothetical protein